MNKCSEGSEAGHVGVGKAVLEEAFGEVLSEEVIFKLRHER